MFCLTGTDHFNGLEQFTVLEHLVLALNYNHIDDEPRAQHDWGHVALMLNSISSSMIQTIEFDPIMTRRYHYWCSGQKVPTQALFDQADIGVLDSIFTRELFGSLKQVRFQIHALIGEDFELLEAHAESWMPQLYERKVVDIHMLSGLGSKTGNVPSTGTDMFCHINTHLKFNRLGLGLGLRLRLARRRACAFSVAY